MWKQEKPIEQLQVAHYQIIWIKFALQSSSKWCHNALSLRCESDKLDNLIYIWTQSSDLHVYVCVCKREGASHTSEWRIEKNHMWNTSIPCGVFDQVTSKVRWNTQIKATCASIKIINAPLYFRSMCFCQTNNMHASLDIYPFFLLFFFPVKSTTNL